MGGGGGEEHESNFKSTKTVNDKVTYWPRLSISNNSVTDSCRVSQSLTETVIVTEA